MQISFFSRKKPAFLKSPIGSHPVSQCACTDEEQEPQKQLSTDVCLFYLNETLAWQKYLVMF